MCSISGVIITGNVTEERLAAIHQQLLQLIQRAEIRGRDSFGLIYCGDAGIIQTVKFIGKPSDHVEELETIYCPPETRIIMNNNRAEPTTEYVSEKSINDIQPFTDGTTVVSHNGTIANDKELEQRLRLYRDTLIDTAILPPLLTQVWNGSDSSQLAYLLRETIIGSYALAIWSIRNPGTLWLATNYKPLSLQIFRDCIFFTSLESSFPDNELVQRVREVKPYTLLRLNTYNRFIGEYSLWQADYQLTHPVQKALVICSGGLDSTTCAKWAQVQGYDVTLLHFKYQCRAEPRELEAVRSIATVLQCPLVEIPVDFFKNVIKHSRLTNTLEEGDLVKDRDGEASAELAWEWVPARNLIFLSIAAGYAEANNMQYLILGGNLEECMTNVKENAIRMFDNTSKLPAEMKINDEVLSYNHTTNHLEKSIVTRVVEKETNCYYKITLQGRKFKNRKNVEQAILYLTGVHPLYVKGRGYVNVVDLNTGDIIMRRWELKQKELQQNTETYNGPFVKGKLLGVNNPMYGHIRSDTITCWCGKIHTINKQKITETMKVVGHTRKFREHVSKGVRKFLVSNKYDRSLFALKVKKGIHKAMERYMQSTGYKHWLSTPEAIKKKSNIMRQLIDEGKVNPSNNHKTPSTIETRYIDFFERNNLPFTYTGMGTVWLSTNRTGILVHFNPDFVCSMYNSKFAIEVTTSDFYYHTEEEKLDRKNNYESVGWHVLFLTEKDLKQEYETIEWIKQEIGELNNGLKVVNVREIKCSKPVKVYNIHCEPNNNFFIGTSNMLTHNSGSYPDNELIFQQKFGQLLPYALNLQHKVEVLTPIANLMKHEIVKLALDIHAPIDLTWSCYENQQVHCGRCGPCMMRRTGFKMAGYKDIIEYEWLPDGFFDDCTEPPSI